LHEPVHLSNILVVVPAQYYHSLNGVNTPWQTGRSLVYASLMKQNVFSPDRNSRSAGTAPAAGSNTYTDLMDFTPSPDEVARRAYFAYENQGARPGHEVQHWLAAEAELIAERNLTRTHGFHHPAQNQVHPQHSKNIIL
jgi:hypothetical protein